MICKDCLHYEVCGLKTQELCVGTCVEDIIHECVHFKDKTRCKNLEKKVKALEKSNRNWRRKAQRLRNGDKNAK